MGWCIPLFIFSTFLYVSFYYQIDREIISLLSIYTKKILLLSCLWYILFSAIEYQTPLHFHGKFGAIKRLTSLRVLTPPLCQSHRDKCFWNFMSSLYVILFYNFVWLFDVRIVHRLSIYWIYIKLRTNWQITNNIPSPAKQKYRHQ